MFLVGSATGKSAFEIAVAPEAGGRRVWDVVKLWTLGALGSAMGRWGGMGWGGVWMLTFLALAHTVDATQVIAYLRTYEQLHCFTDIKSCLGLIGEHVWKTRLKRDLSDFYYLIMTQRSTII